MVPKVVSEVVPKVVSTLISIVVPGNAIVSKMVSKKGIWCGIYAAPKVIPKTHACYTSIKIGAIHGPCARMIIILDQRSKFLI